MKQLRRSVFLAGFVVALLLKAPNAFADEIKTFDLTATYAQQIGFEPAGFFDASGEIVVDTTTDVVEAIDLSFADEPNSASAGTGYNVDEPYPFNYVEFGEAWCAPGCNPNSDFNVGVSIALPVDGLVGYTGGLICSTENPCAKGASDFIYGLETFYYTSGELVLSPEPSSLLLVLTGALGIGAALIRMKARGAQAAGSRTV
jgi:hypothetical protein